MKSCQFLRPLKARTRWLRSSEIADSTITVTSLGDQGVDTVFGIIYPPQVALVGFGKITERPWASNGMVGAKRSSRGCSPPTIGRAMGIVADFSWPRLSAFYNTGVGRNLTNNEIKALVVGELMKLASEVADPPHVVNAIQLTDAASSSGLRFLDAGAQICNTAIQCAKHALSLGALTEGGRGHHARSRWRTVRGTNMKAQGLSDGEPRTLTCEDWMTSEMQTAEPLDSIAHARELLRQHRINQLPIVKDGILVGIATDRDLRKLEHVPQPSHEIPIEAVMSHDVITLEPHSTVIDAALILRRKRIGSVPIVNSGRLVGIVTRSDILEAFILRERRRGRSGSASA